MGKIKKPERPLERLDSFGRNWTKRNIEYDVKCQYLEMALNQVLHGDKNHNSVKAKYVPSGEHVDRSFESEWQDYAQTSKDF